MPSYAITSVDGQIDAESGASWTDTMQTPEITLKPGERTEYARVFVVGVRGDIASDPPDMLPKIEYIDHYQSAPRIADYFGVRVDQLPEGQYAAVERCTISSHNGTHVDAPYHYFSRMDEAVTPGGVRSMRIDEVPLEWLYQPGVKLDFRHLPDGHVVQPTEIEAELARIGHALRPLEIVVVNTRAGSRYGEADYVDTGCGMGRAATLWLTERGIRVVGTDARGFDAIVTQAPADDVIIETMFRKYVMCLPFGRMLTDFRAMGSDLSDSQLSSLAGRFSEFLSPIAAAIRVQVLARAFVHVDETPLPTLDGKRTLWGWVGGNQTFFHIGGRGAKELRQVLGLSPPGAHILDEENEPGGTLGWVFTHWMADGYRPYDTIADEAGIIRLCCLSPRTPWLCHPDRTRRPRRPKYPRPHR